jgi:ribosomal protein L4
LEIKHDDRTKDLIDNVKKEKLKGEIENLKNLINKNDGINRASRLTVNIKI